MENKFVEDVKFKSSGELKEIVINFHSYQGKLVSAARNELSNRGMELTEEEKSQIENNKNTIKDRNFKSQETKNTWGILNVNWKKNIVTDLNSPQLYSRQVINTFSIMFSVVFGGVLLALNLKTVENKKGIIPVLLFSITYSIAVILILNSIQGNTTPFVIGLNGLGAVVLYNFFWGKYIGKEFQYRTKPFWIPMIFGILFGGFFIWMMIIEN